MRRASATRAWVAAHDGVPVAVALVVVSVGTLTYAGETVRGFDEQRIPLWFLYPGVLAMTTGLAAGGRLPTLTPDPRRVAAARGAWAGIVTTAACGGAIAVGGAVGQPGLVVLTAALTGLTWAASVLLGRASVSVGAGVCMAVLVHTRELAVLTPRQLLEDLGTPGVVGGLAVGVVGAVVYAVAPRRGDRDRVV